jgi:Xaa-Pro dipeptidase
MKVPVSTGRKILLFILKNNSEDIMKRFLIPLLLILLYQFTNAQSSITYWNGYHDHINTPEETAAELKEKFERLNKFLDEHDLGGMLFTQVRNVNWITGGRANTQIVLNKDVGAASLLIMRDGKKYLICNASEAGRLMDEELKGLGYELKLYNWYEANDVKDVRGDIIKEISGEKSIGSDIPFPGTKDYSSEFRPLRYSFTEPEIKRYKWLGKESTEAVAEVCRAIKPGMNEFEIEALTSAALRSRGIMPTVLLIAVDERISMYRHGLPEGAVLIEYAMVNIVAEKWGMPIAVTRFVHFGSLPEELKTKLEKTAVINARYLEATKPGRNVSEIFEECKVWYSEAGYDGEWQKHHQGGAIGYDDREYVIYPGVNNIIRNNQPFAWNPTITGAKVEDTMIAADKGPDVITVSDGWPLIIVDLNGRLYPQPSILLRDKAGKEVKQSDYKINAGK